MGESREVIALLAPSSQQRLRDLARRASAYASGRRRFTAESLLATSLTKPKAPLATTKVIEQEGQRAKVRLADKDGKHSEVWQLIQIDGRWRVLLPDELFQSKGVKRLRANPAATRPSTPASQPGNESEHP